MIVTQFTTKNPSQGEMKSYEDFYKVLSAKPTRLGLVSSMYPDLTSSYLTEALQNLVELDVSKKSEYKSIDSLYYEWDVETNHIKRIEFAEVPTQTGENGTEIEMVFRERYFEKYDIFKIDKTHQQCWVTQRPIREADDRWVVTVQLLDNDFSSKLDLSGCQIGDTARFQSNAMPEGHDEGYTKGQSNMERHRNWVTTHRVDAERTALYASLEHVFVDVQNKSDDGKIEGRKIYKMDTTETNLLKDFLYVRDNGNLFNKTSVDANGKTTLFDKDLNRPVYVGDGLIPQIERYADKYYYSRLTVDAFQTGLGMLVEKATQPTGNKIVAICNEKAWRDIQGALGGWLANFKTNGMMLWSKSANDYVNVGATFHSYEYGGNEISFKVDRALTREYGSKKGFIMMVDLTHDMIKGRPAIQMFTIKNGAFISNQFVGVGGLDGVSSGVVSSAVSASKLINWGYSSIAAFSPYKSFLMIEN